MKKLYLVRHAKSSWKHNLPDHQRPLKKRGYSDAHLVSNHIKDKIDKPDKVMSSDAVRAKTTASIFIDNMGLSEDDITLDNQLYDFSGSDLTRVISECDNDIDSLMVFGHNHAMTAFVNTFGDKHVGNVPTSGFTAIELDIDSWKDLKPGKTTLQVFPKELK